MAGRPTERCVPALCFVTFVFLSHLLSRTVAAGATPSSAIKAVNLGGWLVADVGITPSLFVGIDNSDLLDGNQVQFKSVTTGKYLCAEGGGGSIIVANRSVATRWVNFKLWRVDATHFQFRVFGNQFIGLEAGRGAEAVATASTPGNQETFEIVRRPGDADRVRIRAHNSLFLQAKIETSVTADSSGDGSWGDDDPSVFLMTTVSAAPGEFQVTNGYGPDRAPTVMREHWRTFIVEKDFQFMEEKGLNAVRIPVGWWIASGPKPPAPFVGGSLEALDNAFTWAGNYGLKVIIDLIAAPGAQNGVGSSGSRDGTGIWGSTDENIQQTVKVIDFLAQRYANRPNLLAVELLTQPWKDVVLSSEVLKRYYQGGYDAVRKYTPDAYVIMSTRLGADAGEVGELISFAGSLQRTVLDVHYYNYYDPSFDGLTVQQNIDYVYDERAQQLESISTSNGPLTFVGAWAAEWRVQNATKEDYQRFARAQMEVFGRATFGWAYWTFRAVYGHWSLEWMINNGYIEISRQEETKLMVSINLLVL